MAQFRYGDSLADSLRDDGPVAVYGSNGPVGSHSRANTHGPVIVVGRKGSYGIVQWSDRPVFAIDTTYFIDGSTTGQDLRWLYYALQTLRLDEISEDVGVPGLSRERAYAQRIPLPPLPEQRAIADFLDAETARIDALIAKKRRLSRSLDIRWREAVRSRMAALFDKHGAVPLKRLVVCLDGRRVPLSSEERAARAGDVPYYGASGAIDSVDRQLFDETLVLLGEDGAQLADRECEISFVISGPAWVNNHAHVLRPTRADPWFLALHLSTTDRSTLISGSTREKITQADMDRIPVPMVDIALQEKVARDLCRLRQESIDCSEALTDQISLLAERRQALITAAVTGQLDLAAAG